MKSRNLLLTHFSQRYPKIPNLELLSHDTGMNIGVAFDLMTINRRHFERLPHFVSALNALFRDDSDEAQDG